MASEPLNRACRVYVAGHRGLVGSAVLRHLETEGFTNLITQTRDELDLRDRPSTQAFFAEHRPEVVVLAAAKVGGIAANASQPAEFLTDNLQVQLNVIDSAVEQETERFLFLGSSCIYPKLAEQPINEDSLLTGPLEPTNDAYAIAKIAGVLQIQAVRRQYGKRYISAMPTNLFGPGDNYSAGGSHVLPALIRRYHEAVESGASSVTNWGTGRARREFLHVDDLARACLFLLENYDEPAPINVGLGKDLTIAEVAGLVAEITGYKGEVEWDHSKPDGTPQKLLDVARINELGWQAEIGLREGLGRTYKEFLESLDRGTARNIS